MTFENRMIGLNGYLPAESQGDIKLTVSEVASKRVRKLEQKLLVNLEYPFEYMNFPVAEHQNERPFYPIMAVALD